MKKILPLAALVVLLAVACSSPAATPPTPTPTAAAPSPTRTLAPTPSPTAAPTPTGTPIALPSFTQISAPSGSVVWALVAGTRLFRSTDRGDSFGERSLPAQSTNPVLSLVDDREGWAVLGGTPATQCQAQTVTVWHTADGATSWERLAATGIADARCKGSLTFADATRGYLSAYSPNDPPIVYRTIDSGRSWTASGAFADPPGFTSRTGGFMLTVGTMRAFGTTVLAEATGNTGSALRRYAFRSSDGATWTYTATAPNEMDQLVFVSATRWIQIGAPGASKETTDGGASWHAFTTDYQQAAPIAPAIVFGDAQTGYATVRGAIQRTIDGGAHWTSIRTPGTL